MHKLQTKAFIILLFENTHIYEQNVSGGGKERRSWERHTTRHNDERLKLYENSVFIINILSAGVCGRASCNDIICKNVSRSFLSFFSFMNSREGISLIKIECYLITLFFFATLPQNGRDAREWEKKDLKLDIKIDINVNLLRVHKSAHYI